jgi:DNA-binding CsgD family transcriptional regulator
MFEVSTDSSDALRHEAAASVTATRPAATGAGAMVLALMLDEIDYGMLLVDEDGVLLHANHVARQELSGHHPLMINGRLLAARAPSDAQVLVETLRASSRRGMRGLITLGSGESAVNVAVVPMPELPSGGGGRPTLVMLGKRALCEQLSVQWFARSHLLTPAETRVLESLCRGDTPNEIARAQAVAISTVRTQIGSIRTKTGEGSIRALVRRVGLLPPLVTALRGLLTH